MNEEILDTAEDPVITAGLVSFVPGYMFPLFLFSLRELCVWSSGGSFFPLQEAFATAVVFNGDNYYFLSLSESKSCHGALLHKTRLIRVAIEQTGRIRTRE